MKSVDKYLFSVEPSKALNEGWLNIFRIRFLIVSGIVFSVASYFLFKTGHNFEWKFVLATGVFIIFSLYLARYFLVQRLNAGIHTHQLSHYVRDEVINIISSATDMNEYFKKYKAFNNDVAEKIAKLFRAIVLDKTINCGIRLAQEIEGKDFYVTVGRSKNLDPRREKITSPISGDEGIPALLRMQDNKGVCIIRDIEQAIKDGLWKQSESDKFTDLKTLMVAPINGFVDGQKSMLGLLYITSKSNVFRNIHTESCKAVADFLGIIYPIITFSRTKDSAQ
jgi:hypothetical protein